MRIVRFFVAIATFLISPASRGLAQSPPQLHDIKGFIIKGAFNELIPDLMKRRLSLLEINRAGLGGEPTDIENILAWMAKCEKLDSTVEEPDKVQGQISVRLPPNTMYDEAYTACFYALTFNGLGLLGTPADLKLVRYEKHPQLPYSGNTWNRDRILATRLFRLGYLKPDPILRQYRDKSGTGAGHSVLEPKANVLIVTDTPKALESLQAYIDAEILGAMGVPATRGEAAGDELRPPSLGAIASSSAIHFYLIAFARWNHFPLAASQDRALAPRRYPEADVWTSEEGYTVLKAEFQRINEFVRLAQETGGQGWDEPNPARTFTPAEQRRLTIRFGLAGDLTERPQKRKRLRGSDHRR